MRCFISCLDSACRCRECQRMSVDFKIREWRLGNYTLVATSLVLLCSRCLLLIAYCCCSLPRFYCRTGSICEHNLCVLVGHIILQECNLRFLLLGNQLNKQIFVCSIFATRQKFSKRKIQTNAKISCSTVTLMLALKLRF